MNCINFENVHFSYNKNKVVLNDINLDLNKNEIVFIMGHTGSGKSTLIQHINGLLTCDRGKVNLKINDNNYSLSKESNEKRIKEIRKEIGMVFQFPEYQLFETSVLKDVMFGPYNFCEDEEKSKYMAKQALKKVGINASYYDKSPFDLSGGEKRKVAIAGVLASDPSVLVMDEPTSSLDPVATAEMMSLVKKINEEGKMVVIISHDTDLCYEYADRVVIMSDGKIVKEGNVEDVFGDEDALRRASLTQPFVYKVKKIMGINDSTVRCMSKLKEVINNG